MKHQRQHIFQPKLGNTLAEVGECKYIAEVAACVMLLLMLQVKEPSFFVLWYTVDRHVPITTFYDSYYFYYRRWPTPVEARTLLGQLQAAHWQIS